MWQNPREHLKSNGVIKMPSVTGPAIQKLETNLTLKSLIIAQTRAV